MALGKFALAAAVLAAAVSAGVAAWPSGTQKSVVHGVTVAVTPGNLADDSNIWDFAISFDSPGRKLDDEIMEAATLVAPDGRQAKPLWWDGAGPGGTHRAGVLKFISMRPRPKSLELRLVRPGEPQPRVFRFEFGDWYANG